MHLRAMPPADSAIRHLQAAKGIARSERSEVRKARWIPALVQAPGTRIQHTRLQSRSTLPFMQARSMHASNPVLLMQSARLESQATLFDDYFNAKPLEARQDEETYKRESQEESAPLLSVNDQPVGLARKKDQEDPAFFDISHGHNPFTVARRIARHRGFAGQPRRVSSFDELFAHRDSGTANALRRTLQSFLEHRGIEPSTWLNHYNALTACDSWSQCYTELSGSALNDSSLPAASWPIDVIHDAISKVQTSPEAQSALKVLSVLLHGTQVPDQQMAALLETLWKRTFNVAKDYHLSQSLTNLTKRMLRRLVRRRARKKEDWNLPSRTSEELQQEAVYDLLRAALTSMATVDDKRCQRQAAHLIEWADNLCREGFIEGLSLRSSQGTQILLQIFNIGDYVKITKPGLDRRRASEAFWQPSRIIPATYNKGLSTKVAALAMSHLVRSREDEYGEQIVAAFSRFVDLIARRGIARDAHIAFRLGRHLSARDWADADLQASLQFRLTRALNNPREAWTSFLQSLQQNPSDQSIEIDIDSWASMAGMLAADPQVELPDIITFLDEASKTRSGDGHPPGGQGAELLAVPAVHFSLLRSLFLRRAKRKAASKAAEQLWQVLIQRDIEIDGACTKLISAHLQRLGNPRGALLLLEEKFQSSESSKSSESSEPYASSGSREWSQSSASTETSESSRSRGSREAIARRHPPAYIIFRMSLAKEAKRFGEVLSIYKDLAPGNASPTDSATIMGLVIESARKASEHYLSGSLKATSDEWDLGDAGRHFSWRDHIWWDGHPAAIQAFRLFKDRLFAQHPQLVYAAHPFDHRNGGQKTQNESIWQFAQPSRGFTKWLTRLSERLAPLQTSVNPTSTPDAMRIPEITRLDPGQLVRICQHNHLGTNACHINFDRRLFHQFLQLMPYATSSIASELVFGSIPTADAALRDQFEVLAWMRELDIRPLPETLLTLCMHLEQALPVFLSSSDHSKSAAGPVHDYLVQWLGVDAVPTRAQLYEFIAERSEVAEQQGMDDDGEDLRL